MLSEFAELEVVNVVIAFAIVCSLYIVCRPTRQSFESKPGPRHFASGTNTEPGCIGSDRHERSGLYVTNEE